MAQRSFDAFALILDRNDDVAVLKQTVKSGDELSDGSIHLPVTQTIAARPTAAAGRFLSQFVICV